MLKNCPTKNWLEKVIRKSYKYHKSCAKKLSSNSYAEKLSSNSCLKKLYIQLSKSRKLWRRKFFQKGNSAAGISPNACSLAEPLYTTPMVLNDFIKRKVM